MLTPGSPQEVLADGAIREHDALLAGNVALQREDAAAIEVVVGWKRWFPSNARIHYQVRVQTYGILRVQFNERLPVGIVLLQCLGKVWACSRSGNPATGRCCKRR